MTDRNQPSERRKRQEASVSMDVIATVRLSEEVLKEGMSDEEIRKALARDGEVDAVHEPAGSISGIRENINEVLRQRDSTKFEPVTERRCRECGWTEPEYQRGDPAVCSCCGVEYPGDAPERERDWPRCGSYDTTDGTPCDNRVESSGKRCPIHA